MSEETDNIDAQRSGKGRREKGGGRITHKDPRFSAVLEFLQPILSSLALLAILYFAHKVEAVGDALVTTNTQMAVMIEQNKMLVDGYKDHETRMRATEGDMRDVKTRLGMNMRGEPDIPHGR
jgi:hypothetical protein